MTLTSNSYLDKPIHSAYFSAVMVSVASAVGFLSVFMWRDFITGLLKRYEIYDTEKGLESRSDIIIALGIAVGFTTLSALLVVATVRIDGYLATRPTVVPPLVK